MKKLIKAIFVLGFASVITVTAALAQGGPLIQVDEYGRMLINGNPGPPGVVGQDPISGLFTLCYQLPFPVNRGDVVLLEPLNGQISDILRFVENQLYFFSDANTNDPPEPGVLADGPLPPLLAPFVTFTEVGPEAGPNGLFGYTPGPGGIGGSPAFPGLTYDFISDGQVPEPSSFALFGFGSLLAFMWRRQARHS